MLDYILFNEKSLNVGVEDKQKYEEMKRKLYRKPNNETIKPIFKEIYQLLK